MPSLEENNFLIELNLPLVLWIDDDPRTFRYVALDIKRRGAEVFEFSGPEVLKNRRFLHHLRTIRKSALICVTIRGVTQVEILLRFLDNVRVTAVISDLEIGGDSAGGLAVVSTAFQSRSRPQTAIYSGRIDRSTESIAAALGSRIIRKGSRAKLAELIATWLNLSRPIRQRSSAVLVQRMERLDEENQRLKKERAKLKQLLRQKQQTNTTDEDKKLREAHSALMGEFAALKDQMQLVNADHHDLINTSSLTVEALEQLAREPKYLPPVVAEELERARISAKHCDVLVTSLTTLSTQRDRRETPEPSSITVAMTEALQILQRKVPETVTIVNSVPRQLPLSAIPEHLLVRCILNLLLNAIQAVQEGGTIQITAKKPTKTSKILQLDIADDGIGIKKADLPKVFEPRFSTKGDRHGLGLFIVQRILKDYGGSMILQSTRRKGTRVTVQIPIA